MAEVFLGMQEGIGGFEKLVVIKRIFQHYCEDERFLQMFMDEARLAASIRHPNVVEILDIDRDATGFFIVMEYLSGETLGYMIPTLQAHDELPPPHVVCRIAASVASGLHEAHCSTDSSGSPTPIIHRDVTPSNILVSYNGVVKLLDFGVAKAVVGEDETRVRGIKGKLSYLAPEQISNARVDARTDIFQLGIVMHEMLTGQGLFHAGNAHQRVLAVMNREIPPPSSINPNVPPILDDVVLAALEREPDNRLETADVLRARLEEAIQVMGMPASDRDIGSWMREAFPEAYARRLSLERSTAAQMRQSRQVVAMPTPAYISSLPSWTPGSSVSGPYSQHGSSSHPAMTGLGGESSTMTMASEALRPQQQTAQRRRRAWMFASILLILVALGTGIAVSQLDGNSDPKIPQASATPTPPQPTEPEVVETYTVDIETNPKEAVIELDGNIVATGSFTKELERNGVTHALVVSSPGHKPRVITFRDSPPAKSIVLSKVEPEVASSTELGQDDDNDDDSNRAASNVRPQRRRRPAQRRTPPTRRSDQNSTAASQNDSQDDSGDDSSGDSQSTEPKQDDKPPRRRDQRRPATDNIDPWAE